VRISWFVVYIILKQDFQARREEVGCLPADTTIKKTSPSALLLWKSAFFIGAIVAVFAIFLIQPELSDFRDRTIGITILKNVNPYYRNYIYVFALIASFGLAGGVFLLFPSQANAKSIYSQHSLAWLLGTCAFLNFAAYFTVGTDNLFLGAGSLGLLLLVLWLITQKVHDEDDYARSIYFNCLCISWQFASLLFLALAFQSAVTFSLVWIASFCALLVASRYPPKLLVRSDWPIVQYAMQAFLRWLVLAPLLYLVANELSYFLFQCDIQVLTPAGVFFLLSALVILGYIAQRRVASPGLFKLALCVLASNAALIEYSDQIQYVAYDLFHFGERILPLQQWRSYGLLPFVDYLPVHGLFDVFPHFIYQLFSDASPFEALVWGNGSFTGWSMRVVSVVILYSFLAKLVEPVSVFFLLWLLPSFHLIDPYYTLLLLPAIHVLNIQRTKNLYIWWSVQWLLAVIIMLWRLDFGVVLLVGNFVIMVLYGWYYASISLIVKGLLSGICVIGVGLGVFAIAATGKDLFAILLVIKAYLANQIPITSYEAFYKNIDYMMLMQIVIFPGIAVLITAYTVTQVILRKSPVTKLHIDVMIVFLAVVTLIMSLRSLHRHSLIEGEFNNYLFLLVMFLFLVRHLFQRRVAFFTPALAAFTMLGFLVVPKGKPLFLLDSFHQEPKWEYPFPVSDIESPAWKTNPVRLIDTVNKYDEFVSFMDEVLEEGQSFYDFANAPLLYVLADVELPTYIPETMFQTSDAIQILLLSDLASLHRENLLPFVVFRQNNHWDHIDGVDNALRSYLVAEFIYQKYIPCVRVDHFDLWIDRRNATSEECQNRLTGVYVLDPALQTNIEPLQLGYLQQNIAFNSLPYVWAKLDAVPESVMENRALNIVKRDRRSWDVHSESGFNCVSSPCYLDLEIESKRTQKIELNFLSKAGLSFTAEKGSHRYRIRMSSLWHWFQSESISHLELTGDVKFKLGVAELIILHAR